MFESKKTPVRQNDHRLLVSHLLHIGSGRMDAAELSKVVAELRELSAKEGGGDARVQVRRWLAARARPAADQ